ncbi:MAG: Hsp20/alpha crystallin family protein [Thermomicrobiales bacterium]
MSIQRWDPWRDIISLREAMNSLLDDSFARPRAELAAITTGMAIDLRESEDAYIVETVLPGATSDNVDISVLGDKLRIAAEISESKEQQEAKWLVRERRYGSFERSITLPGHVRADEATADFRDGILTVTLPKAEESRARQIPVNTGALSEGSPQE